MFTARSTIHVLTSIRGSIFRPFTEQSIPQLRQTGAALAGLYDAVLDDTRRDYLDYKAPHSTDGVWIKAEGTLTSASIRVQPCSIIAPAKLVIMPNWSSKAVDPRRTYPAIEFVISPNGNVYQRYQLIDPKPAAALRLHRSDGNYSRVLFDQSIIVARRKVIIMNHLETESGPKVQRQTIVPALRIFKG